MLRIGFEDEEQEQQLEPEEIDPKKKEELEQKIREIKLISIPKRRIDELMKTYECCIVQGFNDDYHLSEEEREKNNQFYAIFRKFSKIKRGKIRKLDKYVEVMREALKCLDAVAEKNTIYDPEEFKKMFFRGKIKINGLFLPKYAGRDKKHIDPKYLAEFILSDEDPKEILPKEKEELITDEDFETAEEDIFAGQDIESFLHPNEENLYVDAEFDEEFDNPMGVSQDLDKKEIKKIFKSAPELPYILKDIKRGERNIQNLGKYAFDFTISDFEMIDKYDRENNPYDNGFEPPVFNGDLSKADDYNRYLQLLDDWEMENTFQYFKGNTISSEKMLSYQIQSMFEEHGFNVMKFYDQEQKLKKKEALLKKDEKRAKKIKKKLLAIQKRNERRGLSSSDKKKIKKKKEKIKQKEKKIDDIILSSMNASKYSDISDLDWRRG